MRTRPCSKVVSRPRGTEVQRSASAPPPLTPAAVYHWVQEINVFLLHCFLSLKHTGPCHWPLDPYISCCIYSNETFRCWKTAIDFFVGTLFDWHFVNGMCEIIMRPRRWTLCFNIENQFNIEALLGFFFFLNAHTTVITVCRDRKIQQFLQMYFNLTK